MGRLQGIRILCRFERKLGALSSQRGKDGSLRPLWDFMPQTPFQPPTRPTGIAWSLVAKLDGRSMRSIIGGIYYP